jgi:hypothetical protein
VIATISLVASAMICLESVPDDSRSPRLVFAARAIWTIVGKIVEQHGVCAIEYTQQCAIEALEQGNMDAHEAWIAIHRATERLLSNAPENGERFH